MTRSRCRLIVMLVVMAGTGAVAQEPDGIAVARALYDTASYAEALAALGNAQTPEALRYRALCQLALGQRLAAELTVETMVMAEPLNGYRGEDVPPRLAALIDATRRRLLPGVLRQWFQEARAAVLAQTFEAALPQLRRVIALTDDEAVRADPSTADFRLLADGFLDLAERALHGSALQSGLPSVAPPAGPQPTGPQPAGPPPAVPSGASSTTPRKAAASAVVPSVPLRQDLPPWPAGWPRPDSDAHGSVRLWISSTGAVDRAAIEVPLQPAYDQRVLAAARRWRYQPATLDGRAVSSERLVTFTVRDR